MTVARGAAIGALAVVVILILALFLGRSSARSYKLVFQDAGQLVKGNQVQIGGATVGQVTDIELTDDNLAEITIKVKEGKVLPLHKGTRATIRATSLSGVANRYVSLDPGPNNAPAIPDEGKLQPDSTQSIVDLDQLFNTLDPRTRRGLQQVVQGSADQYEGV